MSYNLSDGIDGITSNAAIAKSYAEAGDIAKFRESIARVINCAALLIMFSDDIQVNAAEQKRLRQINDNITTTGTADEPF